MRFLRTALATIAVLTPVTAIVIIGLSGRMPWGVLLARGALIGLSTTIVGTATGAGIYRLLRGRARIASSVLSAMLSVVLNVGLLALVFRACPDPGPPADDTSELLAVALAAALMLAFSSLVAGIVGAVYGAGCGQRDQPRSPNL